MKKLIICTLLLMLASLSSCSDLLDKRPLDQMSEAIIWSDPALIDGYLRDCYSDIKFLNDCQDEADYGSYLTNQTICLPTNMSDEACYWGMRNWRHFSYYSDANPWYNYGVVRKLNYFLDRLAESPVAESDKLTREGEARFLRAFAYFNMVKRYGGVPLLTVTTYPDSPKEIINPPRAKEDEIYQFIVDEIDWITQNEALPKKLGASDLGRATYWAALALKSRAALYAGSIAKLTTEKGLAGNLNMPDGETGIAPERADYYYKASYDASSEIIDEGGFSLYKTYNDGTREGYVKTFRKLFTEKNHNEIIFAEHFTGRPGRAHSWDIWQAPRGYDGWNQGQFSRVMCEMVDAFGNMDGNKTSLKSFFYSGTNRSYTIKELFGNKDPRFSASIYTEGTTFQDPSHDNTLHYYKGIVKEDGTVVTDGSYNGLLAIGYCTSMDLTLENPFGILKYIDDTNYDARSENARATTDWIVFRLAEIYLNRAEAGFELGIGNPMGDIQEVRDRVGMPPLQGGLTREAIYNERHCELAFEGSRYWDIRRWRMGPEYLGKNPYAIIYQLEYASTVGKSVTDWKFRVVDNGNVYSSGPEDHIFRWWMYYNPFTEARYAKNPQIGEAKENPGWVASKGGAGN